MEDWLDDDQNAAEQADHDKLMRDREYNLMKSEFKKTGYRETVTDAREQSLQEGFDAGFWAGGRLTFRLFQIYGFSQALAEFKQEGSSIKEDIDAFNKEIKEYLDSSRSTLAQYPAPIEEMNEKTDAFYQRLTSICSKLNISCAPLKDFPPPTVRQQQPTEDEGATPNVDLDW